MATENKRRNGYYQYKDKQFPSVSTVLKSAGDSGGLINWAASNGGLGVIWGLSKIQHIEALKEKLLSPSCIEWAKEQAQAGMVAERDRTADFGTALHAGIESYLKGIEVDMSGWTEDMKIGLKTFKDFHEDIGFLPEAVEVSVYSEKFRFGGRLDEVYTITEEQVSRLKPYLMKSSDPLEAGRLITDIKTGSLYIPKQEAQLSAYDVGYEETYKRTCTGGLLINIPREAPNTIKCYYCSKTKLVNAFNKGFLSAYAAWEYFDAPKWFFKQFEQEAA